MPPSGDVTSQRIDFENCARCAEIVKYKIVQNYKTQFKKYTNVFLI